MKRTVLFLTSVLIILGLGTSLFAGGATETIYPDPEKNITVVVPHAAGDRPT